MIRSENRFPLFGIMLVRRRVGMAFAERGPKAVSTTIGSPRESRKAGAESVLVER